MIPPQRQQEVERWRGREKRKKALVIVEGMEAAVLISVSSKTVSVRLGLLGLG